MKPTRGSESKANPNRKMDQAQLQALSGSGSKANPSNTPRALTKLKERSEFAPQPSRSPKGSDSEANPSPTPKGR